MERAEQLADAYEAIARINHYMVGLVETVTADERDDAKEILINRQNASPSPGARYRRLSLAIDLVEHDSRAQRNGTF